MVSGAGHAAAALTVLGQYSTQSFNVRNDGRGGTLVTDPPAVAPTDDGPFVLVTPHP